LLDEPFGALDAKVRKELRRWLRRLHDEMHVTSVFVTHDQEEAMEVADRIVVMNQGRIEQDGAPDEVYDHPASPFVLQFLDDVNRPARAGLGASREDRGQDSSCFLARWTRTNRFSSLMPSSAHTDSVERSSTMRRRIASRSVAGRRSMPASTRPSSWRCSAISSGPGCGQAMPWAGPWAPSSSSSGSWCRSLRRSGSTFLFSRAVCSHERSAA